MLKTKMIASYWLIVNKSIHLHSRRAEKETLDMLTQKGIENAIFHWYSGSMNVLRNIINSGFFFSINSAMIQSDNGKKIIGEIPKELILTETDFPYIEKGNITDAHLYLSNLWGVSTESVEQIIDSNLKRIIQQIM